MPADPRPVPGRVVADVGGTNTRVAIVGENGRLAHLTRLLNDDYSGLAEALRAWVDGLPPDRATFTDAVLAVAAPLIGTEVALTNRPAWRFTRDDLQHALGTPGPVHLVNDFTAIALCLPRLTESDLRWLGPARCRPDRRAGAAPPSPMVVLGPGSGLGVSALVPHACGYCAIASEGGHATLPAHDEAEARLIDAIRRRDGHVSAEALLCGPGLVRLHGAVREAAGVSRQAAAALAPADVVGRADAGDPLAERALTLFCGMLGGLAGNLALTFGAWSGVYLAGGILPRFADRLAGSPFRERFVDKGPYAPLLADVPTALITASEPALLGLTAFSPALLSALPCSEAGGSGP